MASTTPAPLPFTFPRETFIQGLASILLAAFVVAILEGILLQSVFIYLRFYPKDPLYLKIWVMMIVIIQTASCGMVMHTTFFYLVTNYFNPLVVISGAVMSSKLLPIFGAINNLAVQFFFARRALIIGYRYRYITYCAMLINLTASGFWFALSAQAFEINNLEKSTHFGGWIITAGSALWLVGDVLLTGVLIWSLHTNRTGLKRTNSMIDLLITYSISTGLLFCMFNATALGLIVAFPTSTVNIAFLYISEQINTNSVLIALNSRRLIMNVTEVEESEILNPFKSRVATNDDVKSTARTIALPSMIFAAGPSTSTTQIELKDVASGPDTGDILSQQADLDRTGTAV